MHSRFSAPNVPPSPVRTRHSRQTRAVKAGSELTEGVEALKLEKEKEHAEATNNDDVLMTEAVVPEAQKKQPARKAANRKGRSSRGATGK